MGVLESPLVDGNTVVVTPGGTNATMLALDAKTGDVLWKFVSPDGDEAGYSSAIIVESAGGKQYVQLLQRGPAGVDAKSGSSCGNGTSPSAVMAQTFPRRCSPTGGLCSRRRDG